MLAPCLPLPPPDHHPAAPTIAGARVQGLSGAACRVAAPAPGAARSRTGPASGGRRGGGRASSAHFTDGKPGAWSTTTTPCSPEPQARPLTPSGPSGAALAAPRARGGEARSGAWPCCDRAPPGRATPDQLRPVLHHLPIVPTSCHAPPSPGTGGRSAAWEEGERDGPGAAGRGRGGGLRRASGESAKLAFLLARRRAQSGMVPAGCTAETASSGPGPPHYECLTSQGEPGPGLGGLAAGSPPPACLARPLHACVGTALWAPRSTSTPCPGHSPRAPACPSRRPRAHARAGTPGTGARGPERGWELMSCGQPGTPVQLQGAGLWLAWQGLGGARWCRSPAT